MADARQKSRVRHGLIPILVAIRVKAERDRREAEAAKKKAAPEKKKKRGWFG
jgi:cadmium resistance protein CadD (predicted permease)